MRRQLEANIAGLTTDVTNLLGQLEALRPNATVAAATDAAVEQALADADAAFAVLDGVVTTVAADFAVILETVDRDEAVAMTAANTIRGLLPPDGASDEEVVAAAVAVDALFPIDVDLNALDGQLDASNVLINELIIAFGLAESALGALEAALA